MKDLIKHIASEVFEEPSIAVVLSVNKDKGTCDVDTIDQDHILDVRLKATVEDGQDGCLLYPALGSYVIVARIGNESSNYFVSMFSQIESINLNVQGNILDVDDKGFSIKNDQEDLGDILTRLCDEMLKIYAPKNVPGINDIKLRIKRLLK